MKRNQFWGLIWIAVAIITVASMLMDFEWGSVGFTVVVLMIMVRSIQSRNFYGIFLPPVFLVNYFVHKRVLDIPFELATAVLAAIAASIGCSLLFKKKKTYEYSANYSGGEQWDADSHDYTSSSTEDKKENYSFDASFTSRVHYVDTNTLKSVHCTSSFGSLEIHLTQAQMKEDTVAVYLDASFGSVKIYVPATWRVEDLTTCAFGSTEIKGGYTQDTEKVIQIRGNVSFGSAEIFYV